MKKPMKQTIILVILLSLSAFCVRANETFGITIEQQALDVLMATSTRMSEIRAAADLENTISMKAKITIPGLPVGIGSQKEPGIHLASMEILSSFSDSSCPFRLRANLTFDYGHIQFLLMDCGDKQTNIAILPDENVYATVNMRQLLPNSIALPDDEGGLFTMINLMGGIPFGALLRLPARGGSLPDIGFVDELQPGDLKAVIRYRGTDSTPAGIVHVVTIMTAGSAKYLQSMKIWILADSYDLYQVTLEDERGTEAFVTFDKINTKPSFPENAFKLPNLAKEISDIELIGLVIQKIMNMPSIEGPIALDLYASHHLVARTGSIFISSDGFDMKDKETELTCQMEYRSPSGTWLPLSIIEYAGLPPMGHWNGVFAPDANAELGMYSFRVRYTSRRGEASGWMEAIDLVKVIPAPPRVVSVIPINKDTDVPVTTNISVTFSRPMDKASVEKNFFANSVSGIILKGSFSWKDNTMTFVPSDELEYKQTYFVRITGNAKDAEGYGLDGNYDIVSSGSPLDDYIWSFSNSSAFPNFRFVTTDSTIYTSKTAEVKIMARSVEEMHKFNFKVTFDPAILKVEKVDRASFSQWKPRPKDIRDADIWSEPLIDNTKGVVTLICNSTFAGGVSGSGYIATIRFEGKNVGKTSLKFTEASIVDAKGKIINPELRTLDIQVIDFHPQDLNRDGVVDIRDFVLMASDETGSHPAPSSAQFNLRQNYPNPFNPETWIPYDLAKPSYVNIIIYSSTGEVVKMLDLGYKEAGFYGDKSKTAYWDGTDHAGQKVSSGVYFYTIQADGFTATRKMLLSK